MARSDPRLPGGQPPAFVRFVAHPPERRSRGVIIASGCCTTCCCCCCCMHVVGGVVGAALAGPQGGGYVGRWTQVVYWKALVASTVAFVLVVGLVKGPVWAAAALVLGLPAAQLLGSVGVWAWLSTKKSMRPSDRQTAVHVLGTMSYRALLGAMLGLLSMSACILPFLH